MVNKQKAAVIGCGFVGSTTAFALTQSSLFSELVLLDIDRDKADGEAMDLNHGLPFSHPMKVYAGSYDDIADSAVIIITAGANQKPEETRIDLVHKNVTVFQSIVPELKKRDCEGILLVVSNPVDIMTYVTLKLSGFPPERVVGSGTVLDTARLKYLLGQRLSVDSRSIHAFIIGEHGDSELAVWSSSNISGINLDHFYELQGQHNYSNMKQLLYQEVRDSAYEIIEKKQATYYGIAMAVRRIVESIVRDEHSVLPVSCLLTGQYGFEELCLSVPAIVGDKGIERVLDIPLSPEESQRLRASASALRQVLGEIDL